MANTFLRRLLPELFVLFGIAYVIAIIGVAFDIQPPFSLGAAGSVLLFLEGLLLIIAALLVYGWRRSLSATLLVLILSFLVETVGVNTGLPFGLYRYTGSLLFSLPGTVPLAILFAWVLIVFSAYGCVKREGRQRIGFRGALLGATLATLLDLVIEPTAAHIVRYWEWLAPGSVNYYGVPLMNFVAWFLVAFVLLIAVDTIFSPGGGNAVPDTMHTFLSTAAPVLLFWANIVMFGLIDVVHGYYAVFVPALLAWGVYLVYTTFPRRARSAIVPAQGVKQNQTFQQDRDGMEPTEQEH